MGQESIFESIPFFKELWPSLFFHKIKDTETVFNGVQMASERLPGIYDFHFLSIFWNKEPALKCAIIERTEHYMYHRERQQAELENALTLEKGTFAR